MASPGDCIILIEVAIGEAVFGGLAAGRKTGSRSQEKYLILLETIKRTARLIRLAQGGTASGGEPAHSPESARLKSPFLGHIKMRQIIRMIGPERCIKLYFET